MKIIINWKFMLKSKFIKLTLVILAVLLVGVTGYVVWNFNKDIGQVKIEVVEDDSSSKIDKLDINISDWQTYTNENFGFEIKYPKNLNIIKDKTISITNVQGESPTFFAQDGDIWINIYNVENDTIAVFDKVGTVEKNYSSKLGNTSEYYYNADFLKFDAIISVLEYSKSEIVLNEGIHKTLYFHNLNNNSINIISAYIPYKNKKQMDLFDEILKTIKLID